MQHLDEGTIHAWLDGALPAAEGAAVEAHAADCAECAALVAEARGLIARASGILTALDDVPAGVIPGRAAAPEEALRAALAAARAEMGDASGVRDLRDARQRRTRRWLAPAPLRAAAAVAFVALGGLAVLRARGPAERADEMMASAERATLAADTVVTAPSAAPLPAPAPAPRRAAAAEAAAEAPREERVAVQPPRAPAPAAPAPAGNLAATGAAGGAAGGADAAAADVAAGAAQDAAARPAAPRSAPEEQAFGARARTDAQRKAVADVAPSAPALASAKAGARRAAVEGRVTDAGSGGPVEGAEVLLKELRRGAVTDSAGRFVIADAPPGTHTAEVRRMGYASETRKVRVAADGAAELEVALETGALQLQAERVAAPTATPPPAARVERGVTSSGAAVQSITVEPPRAPGASAPGAPSRSSLAGGAAAQRAAVRAIAGCYELSFAPWTPARDADGAETLAPPGLVSLDTARAAGVAGDAYRLRALDASAVTEGSWRVVPGRAGAADSLHLRWSAGERSLDVRLVRDGTSLRGVAGAARESGEARQQSAVRAARVRCQRPPSPE